MKEFSQPLMQFSAEDEESRGVENHTNTKRWGNIIYNNEITLFALKFANFDLDLRKKKSVPWDFIIKLQYLQRKVKNDVTWLLQMPLSLNRNMWKRQKKPARTPCDVIFEPLFVTMKWNTLEKEMWTNRVEKNAGKKLMRKEILKTVQCF